MKLMFSFFSGRGWAGGETTPLPSAQVCNTWLDLYLQASVLWSSWRESCLMALEPQVTGRPLFLHRCFDWWLWTIGRSHGSHTIAS